jgi:hypothetical protein
MNSTPATLNCHIKRAEARWGATCFSMFGVSDDEFIHRLMNALNEFNACYLKRAEARWGSTCFSMFGVSDDEFIG